MADDVVGKLIFKVETDTKEAKKGLDSFQDEMTQTQAGAKKTEQTVDKANKAISMSAVGIALAVGTALVKLGKQVVEATNDIQNGQKSIVNATGATGKSLEGLMASAKKVFASNNASFEDVSDAIGEINTRLGLTDEALEQTTDYFIKFSQVTGQETKQSVQSVTQVMNRWGVEVEKLPDLLDKLTVAGQKSGISVATLEANLTSGAGTLQAMGYSLDEATSMMMSFELAGIDSSQVLMGMKKSFEDSAKAGTDARTDWENLIDAIANSTSEAEANSIAIETFGNRIATDMVTALRNGSIVTDEFTVALEESNGALEQTHETAKTAMDRFEEFKNKFKVLASSLGEGIIKLFFDQKTAIGDLNDAVDGLMTTLDTYKTLNDKLSGSVENLTATERALLEVEIQKASMDATDAFIEFAQALGDADAEVKELSDESQYYTARVQALDNLITGMSKGSLEELQSELSDLQDKAEQGVLTDFEKEIYTLYKGYLPDLQHALDQGGNAVDEWKLALYELRSEELPEAINLTHEYNKENLDVESTIKKLAVAYVQGLLDLDAYSELYPDLIQRIKTCAESIKDMTESEEENNEEAENGEKVTEKKIEVTQEYIDRLKKQRDEQDQAYANELEKMGEIEKAYDMRLAVVDRNADEELAIIRKKIEEGEALEEDYENARMYWRNEEQKLLDDKEKAIAEANAKEVESEQKKANELDAIRQKESDSWTEKLRKQADEAKSAYATELESMGKLEEAYDLRESIIQDEWDREKAILEEKIARNEATEDEIDKLNKYYGDEIVKNNKAKNDAIAKQEKALTDTVKAQNKERFKNTINSAMSLANQFADVYSGIADVYKNKLDLMQKARDNDLAQYEKNADDQLEYYQQMLDLGLMSEEEYKSKKEEIEKQLAKATKDRTKQDEESEKKLRQKVDEMSRKAFEAKKKTAIAQAIIDGASAVMRGFAELGPIAGAVYAGVQAGITTAQCIVIGNQEYVPSYAVGSKYIPKNELAMLHEGEMVLTRKEAGKMREIGGVENLERMVSGSVGTESRGLEPLRIDNNLSAVIEVDGTQLGIAVLKNIDNASQFVLR